MSCPFRRIEPPAPPLGQTAETGMALGVSHG
jgi:hypothetical protein